MSGSAAKDAQMNGDDVAEFSLASWRIEAISVGRGIQSVRASTASRL